jgi:hypothetical protein
MVTVTQTRKTMWEAICWQFPYASIKTTLGLTDYFMTKKKIHEEMS